MKKINYRKKRRSRNRVHGNANRPRLSVFRSNRHLYAQIIDDDKQETLISACDLKISDKGKQGKSTDIATLVGKELARKMKKKGIGKVVFDRSGYKYHGKIKLLAGELRKSGVDF